MPDPSPLYLSIDGVYDAKEMSMPWADVLAEGVVVGGAPADPMKVGPITPVTMGVEIAVGAAWVRNDRTTDSEAYYEGGLWRVSRGASFQLPIAAADPTNPRIDRIILEVLDKQFGAASDLARYRAVAGTPAASPAVPAEPRSALTLATVAVAAAATSIAAGNITDLRPWASLGGRSAGLEYLAYQELSAGTISITGTADTDIIALPAMTLPAGVYLVQFYLPRMDAGAAQFLGKLKDGATDLGRVWTINANGQGSPVYIERRLVLAAGSHTLKITGANLSATTASIFTGPPTYVPAFLRLSRAR